MIAARRFASDFPNDCLWAKHEPRTDHIIWSVKLATLASGPATRAQLLKAALALNCGQKG